MMAGMLLFAVFITGMLFGILAMTSKLVEGQRAQMRQQFHSDLITLVALLGDDGIQVFKRPRAELTTKQRHAAALLLGDLVGRILADPRLDLDGRNDAVDANEQVDLAAAGGEVPCDRPSPASDQEPEGNRLTDRP